MDDLQSYNFKYDDATRGDEKYFSFSLDISRKKKGSFTLSTNGCVLLISNEYV